MCIADAIQFNFKVCLVLIIARLAAIDITIATSGSNRLKPSAKLVRIRKKFEGRFRSVAEYDIYARATAAAQHCSPTVHFQLQ